VGFITHEALRDLCVRYPRITAAFWRETLIDAAIFREWVMNVGQREAYERMAHLSLRDAGAPQSGGPCDDHGCDLPITQGSSPMRLGVTTVHVNRVLQEMRANGIIEPEWRPAEHSRLGDVEAAGDFDPTYLHLKKGQAAA
jgi:CRP-like cAMP-binding protein